jgi:hypothetical protein
MKNFSQLFIDARAVSTPMVAVRTFDLAGTIKAVRTLLGTEYDVTPMIVWDSIHGLRGVNDWFARKG